MEPNKDNQLEISFLKECVPSWIELSEANLTFQVLTGTSNRVYKVTAEADVTPKAVILRKFGDTSAFIDKDKESLIFERLSKLGIGPRMFKKDGAFRVEECFDGQPINRTQINEAFWRRKLAFVVAEYHTLDFSELGKTNVVLDRTKDTNLWKKFLEKCSNSEWTQPEQLKKLCMLKELESAEEKSFIETIIPNENLVFSHNDPLNMNILVTNTDKKVILIDYEYSGYNNRGFDIAGLFTETTIAYDEPSSPYFRIEMQLFPKAEDVADFLRYYIYATQYYKGTFEDLKEDDDKVKSDKWLLKKISDEIGQKEFDKEMEILLDEFQRCCLLVHYYWVPWAVIMSQPNSGPESFDYLSYAYERYQCYLRWKSMYLKNKLIFEAA